MHRSIAGHVQLDDLHVRGVLLRPALELVSGRGISGSTPRIVAYTRWPSWASVLTISSPKPLLLPVTSTLGLGAIKRWAGADLNQASQAP